MGLLQPIFSDEQKKYNDKKNKLTSLIPLYISTSVSLENSSIIFKIRNQLSSFLMKGDQNKVIMRITETCICHWGIIPQKREISRLQSIKYCRV